MNKYIVKVYFDFGDYTEYVAHADSKKTAIQAVCEHFSDCSVTRIECFMEEEADETHD